MSTALGHGLADPKSRGKPVSHANEGRRPADARLRGSSRSNPGRSRGARPSEGKTHAAPVSKGSPVKIPEPEGWTERSSLCSLLVSGPAARLARGEAEGGGSKGRSTGGDAKPTFGILSVIPGRDLFSS